MNKPGALIDSFILEFNGFLGEPPEELLSKKYVLP